MIAYEELTHQEASDRIVEMTKAGKLVQHKFHADDGESCLLAAIHPYISANNFPLRFLPESVCYMVMSLFDQIEEQNISKYGYAFAGMIRISQVLDEFGWQRIITNYRRRLSGLVLEATGSDEKQKHILEADINQITDSAIYFIEDIERTDPRKPPERIFDLLIETVTVESDRMVIMQSLLENLGPERMLELAPESK